MVKQTPSGGRIYDFLTGDVVCWAGSMRKMGWWMRGGYLEGGNYRTKVGALELFSDPSVLASRQKILDDGINPLFPNIPVEELTAIRHYTTNAYTNLNNVLVETRVITSDPLRKWLTMAYQSFQNLMERKYFEG
jgi:hypothetical protein